MASRIGQWRGRSMSSRLACKATPKLPGQPVRGPGRPVRVTSINAQVAAADALVVKRGHQQSGHQKGACHEACHTPARLGELGGVLPALMAYLDPKGKGRNSMPAKQGPEEAASARPWPPQR